MSTLAYRLRLRDRYGDLTLFGMFSSIILGAVALTAAVVIGLTLAMRSYGRTTCGNWADATGIASKFVVLNWGDTGTCLARTPDGRWVVNSKWQAFVSGSSRAPEAR